MPIKQNAVETCRGMSLLQGQIISKETIDLIFNDLENQLLDKVEIMIDLKNVTFISTYFLVFLIV